MLQNFAVTIFPVRDFDWRTKPSKKLQRGSLVFRKEGTKGFIERLALWSDVVNWKIENCKPKGVNSTNESKRQRMSGTLAQRYHSWDIRAKQRL